MSYLHAVIILPFLFAVGAPLLYKLLPRVHTGWWMLPVPAILFTYMLSLIAVVKERGPQQASISWIPSLGIDFNVYADGLSLLFAMLITGIGILVVLYSIFYLDKDKEKLTNFYIYLMLFMGAMLGLVLSDNVMVLYGFWELTSISSFLLIAFWHGRKQSTYGALKSLVITVIGGLAMFVGFLLLYLIAGTFSIRELISEASSMAEHSLFIPAMLLLLLGAFTKSAQFPFHIWLPDAMEAPTPVSAYLHSATMVKAGIYLVARMSPVFAGEALWLWLVSGIGLITLIYGSYRAMKQKDLKAMLAFSTISQLGLVMSLFGLGSAAALYTGTDQAVWYSKATMAAIFHMINHAIFKGALFMVVGIVDHETGTRDIRKLGGLMAVMPITFTIALIGSFSMAGIPPFNGFLSKEMFFTAVLNIQELQWFAMDTWGVLFPIIAWIGSIFTFVYSMLIVFRTFGGKLQQEKLNKKPHEAPIGMLISPVVLASFAIVFGLFPNILSYSLIEPAMAAVHPYLLEPGKQFMVSIELWHGFNMELLMTAGVVVIGLLLFYLHKRTYILNAPLFQRVSLNQSYDSGLALLERGSGKLTRRYMTGSIRHYLIYIFLFIVVSLSVTLFTQGAFVFDTTGYAEMSFYEVVVIIALIASTIAVPFATTRLMAILLTGVTGYVVTLFFVIFRAPDLALTQIIVETVSVALFLLCFYYLPELKKESIKMRFKLSHFMIALSVGTVMTLVALSVSGSGHLFESISHYFLENSYKLAGGKNVVNVILVDFRGFDTMFEIVVLGIASFGIYALIRLKLNEVEGSQQPKRQLELFHAHGPRSNDVLLQTLAKLIIIIILLFSLYMFYMGHNHPGGGFIGALMASAAFLLMAMTYGMDAVNRRMPISFQSVTAIGILIAVATGMGSFLFDVPFLSHTFGYFDIPLLGEIELATATLFDLGVYLTVIGVAMTIILTIGRDK